MHTILLVIALIAFVLAAIGFGFKKVDLIAIGLAAWVLSFFIGDLGHFSLPIILEILAFIAFGKFFENPFGSCTKSTPRNSVSSLFEGWNALPLRLENGWRRGNLIVA